MTRFYGAVAFWLLIILPLVGLFQALKCGDRYLRQPDIAGLSVCTNRADVTAPQHDHYT